MSKTTLTCITCPIGCELQIEKIKTDGGTETFIVQGNKCKRGEKYAIEEMTYPTRMVTTTVKIDGAHLRRIPVKTSKPIPKDKIYECMRALDDVTLKAPIECGEKVIENWLSLGIDVVTTRSMGRATRIT